MPQWPTLWLYLGGLITARFGQCGIHSDYTLVVLSQHDLVIVAYTLIIPWWSYHSTIWLVWHTLWLYLDGLITARFGQCGIHSDYTLMVLSRYDLVSVAYTLIIPWWSYHSTIWSVWHTLWLHLDGLITARFGKCDIHSDYTLVVLSQYDLISVACTLITPWWSYHSTIW
jgi:hypothetical protein